jgi:hypothetical protein
MPKRLKQSPPPPDVLSPPKGFRTYMAALGRKGGIVSGARRMDTLTAKQRSAIARKAARARWAKRKAG